MEPPKGLTDVVVRGKAAPWWLTMLYQVAIVPADFVMATGMLRGLKQRVEARSLPTASGREPLDQATYEMASG